MREQLTEDYKRTLTSPYVAAERGCVDDVIAPSETRTYVLKALRALRNKRVVPPPKKHSNIPL
jgi:propionyl-CoA carboxylase beta chain